MIYYDNYNDDYVVPDFAQKKLKLNPNTKIFLFQ